MAIRPKIFVYEAITAGALGGDPAPSLLAEGRAMRTAAAADFAAVGEVVTQPLASNPADERRRFEQLVSASDAVLVIAPEFDALLADRSDHVLAAGRRLLGSRPDAVRLAGDKLALADHWTRRGVPTPATRRADEPPAEYPVVIKPRDGAGSQGVRRIARPDDWPTPTPPDTLVQPFVAGRACSVAFLIGPGGVVPLRAGEQTLSHDFQYGGGRLPLSANEEQRAFAIGRAAIAGIDGLAGFVGVDLVLGETDVAIEINPRLTTSYIGLRALCQDNLAVAWMDVLEGRSPALSWRAGEVTFLPDGPVTWRTR